jgi:hypothetical protein
MRFGAGVKVVVTGMFGLVLSAGNLGADSGRVRQKIAVKTLFANENGPAGHEIQGSNAMIVRTEGGIDVLLNTKELEPGELVDVLIAVFNNSAACSFPNPATGSPCSPPDLFNPATQASLHYVDTLAANEGGNLHVDLSLDVGFTANCVGGPFPCNGLTNPYGAEIHIPLFAPNFGPGRETAQFLPPQ